MTEQTRRTASAPKTEAPVTQPAKKTKLTLSYLRMPELSQFSQRFLDDLSASNLNVTSDPVLSKLVADFKKALPPLQESLEQIRSSDKTKQLSKADRERDEDYAALKAGLRAFRTAKRETEQQAYQSLYHLLDQYKKSTKANYEEQTALLSALLSKLKATPYREQLRLLGLQRFVDNLTESNKTFNSIFASRSQEKLARVSYDRKALRNHLIASYKDLHDYSHILARVKGDKLYHDLVAILNNSRKYYADLLAKRR